MSRLKTLDHDGYKDDDFTHETDETEHNDRSHVKAGRDALMHQEDHLLSDQANDNLRYSSDGNNYPVGSEGLDHVHFDGTQAQHSLSHSDGAIQVSRDDLRSDHETLKSVERIHFADHAIAYDIDGHAGQAYRLYEASLNRTPDLKGLGSWIKFMDEGGALAKMAENFITSDEFRVKYGALDDRAFVNQLYQNVLNRDGDGAGVEGWVNALANGYSRGQILLGFSESAENRDHVIGQIKDGITYSEWWLS